MKLSPFTDVSHPHDIFSLGEMHSMDIGIVPSNFTKQTIVFSKCYTVSMATVKSGNRADHNLCLSDLDK